MHHLMIDLDHADLALPDKTAEISVLELLYQAPATEESNPAKSDTATDLISEDARELISGLAAFTVDVTCQLIALAAAMPFIPNVIGKQIYRPLVRRLRS